jgi:perosamine synthetase
MRAPLRIDINKRDLARAAFWVVAARGARAPVKRIRQHWRELGGGGQPLICLSVRSAFDLFLSVRRLPHGSEVAISAITHPDMPRLLRAHGLVPVPLDLEPTTLAPSLETIERAVSPKTRALLLTHLLGGSVPTDAVSRLCTAHGLELWEDCAQRFPAIAPRASASTVSFYSFGPLKTATALLGAVADVRDPSVRAAMLRVQATYPAYKRTQLAWRTGKLAALAELASHPWAYGTVITAADLVGLDPRSLLRTASKSFGATTDLNMLRRRPSAATLRLLSHRLDPRTSHARTKTELANGIARHLAPYQMLGAASNSHHWLFVVRSTKPVLLQQQLLAAGFDALRGISNLEVVPIPEERPEVRTDQAIEILRHAVVVPIHPDYRPNELERLVRCLQSGVLHGE